MRSLAAVIGLSLVCMAGGVGHGQTTDVPAGASKPKVYALIAAIGEEFTTVTEVRRVGSHLSPYRRHTSKVADNVLNRLALHSLDSAIQNIDPASTRITMSVPAATLDGVAPSMRDRAAISAITAELANMPGRLAWDRIVVATSGFRALDRDGMPSKVQGFGIFSEPQCQAGCPRPGKFLGFANSEPVDGVDATTSDNESIKASTYVAPYSYIEVWILDPKTLEILDMQQGFDSQKLAEHRYKAPMDDSDWQKYLASRFVTLVEKSVGEAIMHSELNTPKGKSEVGPIRRVEPDEAAEQAPPGTR
jgi:hypothetical protein